MEDQLPEAAIPYAFVLLMAHHRVVTPKPLRIITSQKDNPPNMQFMPLFQPSKYLVVDLYIPAPGIGPVTP